MAAGEKAVQVIDKLRGLRLTRAAELVEETLAYYAFPEEHWRRIRTRYETPETKSPGRRPAVEMRIIPRGRARIGIGNQRSYRAAP